MPTMIELCTQALSIKFWHWLLSPYADYGGDVALLVGFDAVCEGLSFLRAAAGGLWLPADAG